MGEDSSWITEVNAALEKDEANYASEFLVWKIPSRLRTDAELYEPHHWRFGLHHCSGNLHSSDSETFKVQVVRALQLSGNRWNDFCKRVVVESKDHWIAVYSHSRADSFTIEEIRSRLTLDAISLVVIYQNWGGGYETLGEALQKVVRESKALHSMWEPFALVENQIPMKLLQRVVDILVKECTANVGKMKEWESDAWKRIISACIWRNTFSHPLIDADVERKVLQTKNSLLQHAHWCLGVHMLDCTYRLLCGRESLEAMHTNYCPQNYSATYLEASGVTIKGKPFDCFENVGFEKGCLSVPFLRVRDTTELYLRNLLIHESLTRSHGCIQYAARCYTDFMAGLMRTPEDVMLLEKLGIVCVEVGSREMVCDMWKRIDRNIAKPYVTSKFLAMMTSVTNYSNKKRNQYRYEFKRKYCSRPWVVLSYVAATAVTISTLIDCYVSITGSDGMKPRFKHPP